MNADNGADMVTYMAQIKLHPSEPADLLDQVGQLEQVFGPERGASGRGGEKRVRIGPVGELLRQGDGDTLLGMAEEVGAAARVIALQAAQALPPMGMEGLGYADESTLIVGAACS
jgi:hypothetical protein